mmetsp:Transcript_20960/g.45865  ORF Transcript_20960/g.45865 Transcript_20960/m.45865 type:complete len:707 (+) Transcript_20960:171-2291(+)|eukprot:CAMPEP_0202903780 /NCGR_PEP_ID=MMETSP1392-20130828/26292_1 /ASSEMBLY_ACC=CAM_ASM_000868 /TAXON_ID=225041 /ORGANISM="Chlamydomonas chlamydogama, Strain SAG 11-48b" /LENGTH=706 /DNA_ID=CAMNT_0049591111 /DNA_START=119 /DNA_END=2239 /DNA_ORIENTATION=-
MASNTTTASLAPGLARKVKKILEIKTEAPDLISSLTSLSTFYEENTPAARRSLRTTIEKRGLQINDKFITAAEAVIKALDEVQSHLDGLSSSCTMISNVLSTSKASTGPLLSDTERLTRELEAVERKGQLIGEFLEQYQLAPQEVAALQGEEVGPHFFAALSRVRQIHENCRSLLRTHHQRAGLELMELMATYQETAYERLCRWVQGECRNIGEFDAPEVDSTLQAAVRALRERPVLFKYCAEEVATARHNALFQRFITALTRGGPSGMPRPIEIHAHDPKRYINDMLAWVHQALAGEREFVVALFGDEPKEREALPTRMSSSGGGAADAADNLGGDGLGCAALLDRIFESICRPLKVRIEQVLMTSPPLLLCFQLAQLHSFYLNLVVRVVGHSSQLSAALRSCRDMATRVFYEQIRARGDKLLRAPPPPPKDLSPPPQVAETSHQVLEIITAYESALEASPAPQQGGSGAPNDELSPVLGAVLDPLVEMCERSAEALTPDAPSRVDEVARLDPAAHRIYLINCLSSVMNALGSRSSAAPRVRHLADMVEGHVSALVGGEVGRLLARCGLAEVVERLRLYKSHLAERAAAGGAGGEVGGSEGGGRDAAPALAVPASDPALSLPRICEAMRTFFVLVSSPDALPEFLGIQAPRTRADAVSRVARSLVEAYEMVHSALDDPTSGYLEQGGSSAVKHSPAQVRTILGVL